jgi:hypothetical protein
MAQTQPWMNKSLSAVLLTIVLTFTTGAAGDMRTWNFKSGATLKAELVAFPSPDSVQVRQSDSKLYTLPASYLSESDQAYLATERAKQWKQVSVDRLLDTPAPGKYWKCAVTGKAVPGTVMVSSLPTQAEAVLKSRRQQELQITNLSSRIQHDSDVAHKANAAAARSNRAHRRADKAQAKLATADESAAKSNLNKLKADYAANLKTTKPTTTLVMKDTGTKFEGLPVWECQIPNKRP